MDFSDPKLKKLEKASMDPAHKISSWMYAQTAIDQIVNGPMGKIVELDQKINGPAIKMAELDRKMNRCINKEAQFDTKMNDPLGAYPALARLQKISEQLALIEQPHKLSSLITKQEAFWGKTSFNIDKLSPHVLKLMEQAPFSAVIDSLSLSQSRFMALDTSLFDSKLNYDFPEHVIEQAFKSLEDALPYVNQEDQPTIKQQISALLKEKIKEIKANKMRIIFDLLFKVFLALICNSGDGSPLIEVNIYNIEQPQAPIGENTEDLKLQEIIKAVTESIALITDEFERLNE